MLMIQCYSSYSAFVSSMTQIIISVQCGMFKRTVMLATLYLIPKSI